MRVATVRHAYGGNRSHYADSRLRGCGQTVVGTTTLRFGEKQRTALRRLSAGTMLLGPAEGERWSRQATSLPLPPLPHSSVRGPSQAASFLAS